MKKFTFIAYKPSSSHANCSRGCCGYTEYESDFTLAMVDTPEELSELFYSHCLRNMRLGHGEDGFITYIIQEGEKVFSTEWSDPLCEDNCQAILDAYDSARCRATNIIEEEKEKKLQAEKAQLKKEADARDAARRQQYEKLKEEFGEK